MAEARLATGLWVSALLHRLDAQAVPAYLLARGDDTAGAVALIAVRRDGTAVLWLREYDFDADARIWRAVEDGPAPAITAAARRQRAADPDLWLIELEAEDAAPILAQI